MQPRSPDAVDGSRLVGFALHDRGRELAPGAIHIAPGAGRAVSRRRPNRMAKRGEAR